MNRLSRIALWTFSVLVLGWLTLPTLVIIPLGFTDKASFSFPPSGWSLRWYSNILDDPQWLSSIGSSLLIAAAATVLATVIGTSAALGLRRLRSDGARNGLRLVFSLPLVVPEIVLGVAVYAVFLRMGLVGTLPGFAIAHAVLGVPLVLTTVGASLANFDANLERAAASLGAPPWETLRRVTLPLMAPGVLAGALFAFILSFDNVMISIFLQSPTLNTLPVKMWSSMTRDTDPTIAAVATVTLVSTIVVLVLAFWALGRRNQSLEKGMGL